MPHEPCERPANIRSVKNNATNLNMLPPLRESFRHGEESPLDECDLMVALSPRSVESVNVQKEVGRAVDQGKPVLAVYIEEVDLVGDLAYDVSSLRYLSRAGWTTRSRPSPMRSGRSRGGRGSRGRWSSEDPPRRSGRDRRLNAALKWG